MEKEAAIESKKSKTEIRKTENDAKREHKTTATAGNIGNKSIKREPTTKTESVVKKTESVKISSGRLCVFNIVCK